MPSQAEEPNLADLRQSRLWGERLPPSPLVQDQPCGARPGWKARARRTHWPGWGVVTWAALAGLAAGL